MTPNGPYWQEVPRFTRRWWWNLVRDLFWSFFVAVLIWLYADMEKTVIKEFERKTLRLTVKQAKDLALLDERDQGKQPAPVEKRDVEVAFKLRGSSAALDRFTEALNNRGGLIEIDAGKYGPGKQRTSTADLLSLDGLITGLGLTVDAASPQAISVSLDRLIRVADVPVKFEFAGAELAGEPTIEPAKVSVTVPASLWQDTRNPVLKTVVRDLQNEPPEGTLNVPIVCVIGGAPVEPEVRSVRVAYKVRQYRDKKTVTATVNVLAPETWLDDGTWAEYEIKRKSPLEWRKQVTFAGAPKDLDRLRPEDVQAYVVLTEGDKKFVESWLNREVILRLPPDLNLKLEGAVPTVDFKLEKRAAPPAP